MAKFIFRNPGGPAVGIGIQSTPERRDGVSIGGREVEHWLVDPAGSWFGFTWLDPVPTGGVIAVVVSGESHEPEPGVTWLEEQPDLIETIDGFTRTETPGERGIRLIQFADAQDADPKRVKYRKFFSEYEVGTTRASQPALKKLITDTTSTLWTNCLHRGEAAHCGRKMRAEDIERLPEATLTQLSKLQMTLVQEHFPSDDPEVPFDVPSAEDAFERFAAGELARESSIPGRRRSREADSANLFLWAEFAMLAIHQGSDDADKWLLLLNVLVRMQTIFFRRYRKSSRTINGYPPPPKPLPGTDPDAALRKLKEDLRKEYDGLDESELLAAAGRNSKTAFYDDTKPRSPCL